MPKISFLGAAGNVTGSRYLFEDTGAQLLVDCGLFQEREFQGRNWNPSPLKPSEIEAVILTHAHLDHCGLLPKLVHDGFKGRIYGSAVTLEMVEVMLLDSARIQEEDADAKRRRHRREGRRGKYPEDPLYTVPDARACFPLFTPVNYGEAIHLAGITASLADAGHVLGSAMVFLEWGGTEKRQRMLFSGDVGRPKHLILNPPEPPHGVDYLVVESTYGDRIHEPAAEAEKKLARIINETKQRGGNIVIPAFALERTQELLYYLKRLLVSGKIPPLPVFVDSPMANRLTNIFARHSEFWGEDVQEYAGSHGSPFNFPGLELVASVRDSRAVGRRKGSCIIIAGSGMATGGRVKHHLVNNIHRPQSTVLFVGYQAQHTLGREMVSGRSPVRILGKQYAVKARIEQLDGLSAHADRDELLEWLGHFKEPPRRVFVTHGEEDAANAFAAALGRRHGWTAQVPAYGDSFEL